MSVPSFIDVSEAEQTLELRVYLKGKGAEISEVNTNEGLAKDLQHIIDVSDVLWKEGMSDTDVESTFNSILSLLLVVPAEQAKPLIANFCEKMSKSAASDKRNSLRIRLLSLLFQGLDDKSTQRYNVYLTTLKLATKSELVQLLNPDVDEIKVWLAAWDVGVAQSQQLLRVLHEAFLESKQSEKAMKVMLELLATYTEENASHARDDAHRCIVTCLADPNIFIMDHLLMLKPVRFLEGELIHDLLTVFVSGTLKQYLDFYNANKDFVSSIGLSHDSNVQKMRTLTFIQLAEGKTEVSFDTIQREMQIGADDIEGCVIDVIRTKLVRARIDQLQKRILVSMTAHRTFGRQQWLSLREQLVAWQRNVDTVLHSLNAVAVAH